MRFTEITATVKRATEKNGNGKYGNRKNGNRKNGQRKIGQRKNERVGKKGNMMLALESRETRNRQRYSATEKRAMANLALGKGRVSVMGCRPI